MVLVNTKQITSSFVVFDAEQRGWAGTRNIHNSHPHPFLSSHLLLSYQYSLIFAFHLLCRLKAKIKWYWSNIWPP